MNVSFNGTIPEDCWGGTVTGLRISANNWLVLVPLCWCYHHHYNCTLATCNRADPTVQPSIGVPSGLGQLVGDPSVPLFHDIHICACNSLPLCLQLTVAGVYILMFITIFSEDCISWFALAFYMLFFEPITCTHVEWCMELIWHKSRPSFILPVCAIVNKVVPTQLSFLYSPAQCILTSWTCYCEGDDNDNWNWAIIQFLTNRRVSLTAWISLILWILFLVAWNEWVHRDFTFHLGSLQLVHNLLTTLNIRWHFSPLYIFPM